MRVDRRGIPSPLVLAVPLALAGFPAGCDRGAPAASAPATTAKAAAFDAAAWQKQIDVFLDGWFERNPAQAANAGKHQYDGQLPDWSAAGLAADIDWMRQQREAFAAVDP